MTAETRLAQARIPPYYDDGTCVIYHGDCREMLPLQADATITDPPYGTGHYATDTTVLTPEMLRAFPKPSAVFGWPEKLVGLCVASAMVPDEWVTWWPTNGAIRGTNMAGLWRESECIAVFGPHTLNELRRNRTDSSRRIVAANYDIGAKGRGDSHGELDSRHEGDVWTDAAPGLAFQAHLRLHPNQKPLGLSTRLVAGLSQPDETILDPFMGSGTTLRAAKDLGRRAIGIEIEERYCEIAARRLAQEVLDFRAAL